MPYVRLDPPMGPLNVFYSISTPLSHDADEIVPGIPTILFLHPVYMPQQLFEAQFADPELRQFNLVAFDMRSHGRSEGVVGDAVFDLTEDISHFMDALRLPACHIVAVSVSCNLGLELASKHAEKVLSLTLCSPLTPNETEDVEQGRLEVFECWKQASMLPLSLSEKLFEIHNDETLDEAIMGEAVIGVKQLAFNNEMTALTQAIATSGIEQGIAHWVGPPERVKEGFQATIRWPLERKTFTREELRKITVPVMVFYCWQDVAYTVENARTLNAELLSAGVRSELFEVNGPHYGIVDGASVINPRIRDLVLSCYSAEDLHSVPISAEYCTPTLMKTPFQDLLANYDYQPEDAEFVLDFDI